PGPVRFIGETTTAAMRLLSGVPASRLTSPRISFARSSRRSMGANGPPSGTAASSSSSSATAGAGGGAAQKPWLFVGLGNPGRMYKGTRHNVGFEMIDAIAEAEGISVSTKQFKSMVGKGLIGDVPVMLAKPQTFMNASGESVSTATLIMQLQITIFSRPCLLNRTALCRSASWFHISRYHLIKSF
uniref:Peptidyl-tRNA hydrolase n=3 Tax=Aegilops tauschii subsp. strangulata TaxID=200361 RepID=A0A452ZS08_AEGTS